MHWLATAARRAELRRAQSLEIPAHAPTASAPPPHAELGEALERLRRFGGDTLVREMIDLFLEAAPARLAAVRNAAARGDAAATRLAAHAMVSSCAQLGALHMSDLCRAIERDAGAAPARLAELCDALAAELDVVRELLDARRPDPETPV